MFDESGWITIPNIPTFRYHYRAAPLKTLQERFSILSHLRLRHSRPYTYLHLGIYKLVPSVFWVNLLLNFSFHLLITLFVQIFHLIMENSSLNIIIIVNKTNNDNDIKYIKTITVDGARTRTQSSYIGENTSTLLIAQRETRYFRC